ncbi:hypothetical protein A0J61_10208 [Choanephora cucurbitarum]|uniref:Uncharacterized protein n=1 Tax=Choanephora cucurbitarum TaxID=101091 RepID=A0A1C7N327_9FUNG|nr:hypothetical protein A0J61_10208 [Choanephora cucurbitarum]
MTSLGHNEPDIMDIQDKIGYVDTGPIPSSLPSSQPIIVSNAHLTIKEPKPQRQVWMENKRPQPILVKKATPVTTLPEPKAPLASLKPTVSFTPSTKGKEKEGKSDELKDMMVSKLYELADMLKSMNMDQESVRPRPTASTSDPARFIRRKSVPSNKPPDLRRNLKSAESMFQHPQEPYYPHYYLPPTSQHYYPYYPEESEDGVDELDKVDDLHLEDEDQYYHAYYPYYPYPHFDYEEDPRLPRHRYGPRRKSLGNLYEEHYYPTLQRKSSKNNLRRRQPTLDPRYDYPPHTTAAPMTPRYRYPPYYSSPNGYYV